jgi:hypothetical protein
MASIYRPKWRSIGKAIKLVLSLGIPILTSAIVIYALNNPETPLNIYTIFFGGILVLLIGSSLILPILLVNWICSYLKISAVGLEYHRWPFNTIVCFWSEVERISHGKYNGKPFASLLISRHEPGREISLGKAKLGSAKYKIVPLSDFKGWPEGNLSDELRTYAPRLFAQETYAENIEIKPSII